MYSKLEILAIFTHAKTINDFEKVCDTFKYLIDNGFEMPSTYLSAISHIFFRKLTNQDCYGSDNQN
jgi:hypothetical protein